MQVDQSKEGVLETARHRVNPPARDIRDRRTSWRPPRCVIVNQAVQAHSRQADKQTSRQANRRADDQQETARRTVKDLLEEPPSFFLGFAFSFYPFPGIDADPLLSTSYVTRRGVGF